MAGLVIGECGSGDLKERVLPDLAAGDLRISFDLTEPEAGTNSFKITTAAQREGDEYVVIGQKIWTPGAGRADYVLLAARTTP